MSSMSRASQRAFGPANTRIVRQAIALRGEHDKHDAWRRAFVQVLIEELDGDYRADFDPQAREYTKELAEAHMDVNALSRREVERFNRTRGLMLQGRHEEAWSHLEPLADARPNNPRVAGSACFLQARLLPDADETLDLCQKAYKIAPDDPAPALFLAHIHIDRDQMEEAAEIIEEARRRMDVAEKVHAQQWSSLGRAYAHLGALTLAEQAVARAPMVVGATNVRHYVEDQRRYFGLRKGAVPAEAEADFVARLRQIEARINHKKLGGVDALVVELRNTYADVAATEAITCEYAIVSGAQKRARNACARALELDADSALAHTMSGIVAMSRRDAAGAQRHFEKARDLVPREERMWARLARFYKTMGKKSELQTLQKDYEKRFGRPLAVK
jgi:predicted Zn-dependent protease